MSKLLVTAGLSLIASFATATATASEVTPFAIEAPSMVSSTAMQASRAEVRAEVLRARADGTLDTSGEAHADSLVAAPMSRLTRDAVAAEARARARQVDRLYVGG